MKYAIRTAAAVLAMGFTLAYVGPALNEAHDTASELIEAQQSAQRQARFERAAQAMCGENAGWRMLESGAVQCFTKRGHKTVRVTL